MVNVKISPELLVGARESLPPPPPPPLPLSPSQHYCLNVHSNAMQCFNVDFLRSKMAARRLEAVTPANELQALSALAIGAFQMINVTVSVNCP